MYLHVPERAPLLTARLTLEPLAGGHAAHLWGPLQDPALYEWIGSSPPPDVETLRARWSQLGAVAGGTSLGWAARRSSDSAWIGKLDATIDHAGVATNVGYLFFRPYWGRGYASEAVVAVADHLRGLGIGPLLATVTVGNDASCRVLEKAGFRRTGRLPGNDVLRGRAVDDWRYER
jgi:ribosomal-protein-alanine N-acetyltransferase